MRGIPSPKLKGFIEQANLAAEKAEASGIVLSPSLVRESLEKMAVFIGKAPELAYAKEKSISTPDYEMPVRVYSPAPNEALPVVVYYHGGGHMCGNIALYDSISSKIAKAGHCIVITVEYRLAPEFPYPSAIEDSQYVLEHYQEMLDEVKFNQQLIIAGDSAGGAICTTLASNNIDNNKVKIDKQILIYPSVDYTFSYPSVDENGTGFLLEKSKIDWYFKHYFQENENNKACSPLFMKMAASMPETIVFTAGCDPLRDESIAYAEALSQAGVKVKQHTFDGMIHAYMMLDILVSQECEETYQMIGDFIRA